MSKVPDLFDVLDISTREDTYTTLLANFFGTNQGKQHARRFFKEVFGNLPPEGNVEVKTRPYLKHENIRKADIPDLVLAFGDTIRKVWIIEAKIKSGESSDQLQRYTKRDNRSRLVEKFASKRELCEDDWLYSYLTLECEEPSGETDFEPIDYKSLCKILPLNPDLPQHLSLAYDCLRERLFDYYEAREETPPENASIKGYLDNTRGLIDRRNRFHWLMDKVIEEISFALTEKLDGNSIVAQGKGSANPGYQIRASGWQTNKVYDFEFAEPLLSECFDIHLELQLTDKNEITFVLHYETNPYITGLNNDKRIPLECRQGYWETRKEFAEAINCCKETLKAAGWNITMPKEWTNPPPQSRGQVAKMSKSFKVADSTVGDFHDWLKIGMESILPSVYNAGLARSLW